VWDTDAQRYYLYGVGEDGGIWRSSFNRAGNFFNDWTALTGSTPSPIAAAAGNLFLNFNFDDGTDDIEFSDTAIHTLQSKTILCPFDGYVVATGSGSIFYSLNASAADGVRIFLTETSGESSQYRQVSRQTGPSAGETMIYPFSYQRVFQVTEGQDVTIYLTAQKEFDTSTQVEILNPILTLEYFPYAE
jgi:hypothetical protein